MNCSSLLPTHIFLSCILKGLRPKYSISQAYGYSQGLLFLWLLHGSHTTQELSSLPVVLITGKTYRGPIAFPTPNCVWGGGGRGGRLGDRPGLTALTRSAKSPPPSPAAGLSRVVIMTCVHQLILSSYCTDLGSHPSLAVKQREAPRGTAEIGPWSMCLTANSSPPPCSGRDLRGRVTRAAGTPKPQRRTSKTNGTSRMILELSIFNHTLPFRGVDPHSFNMTT